jgi:hypothetical protein
VNGHNKQSHNTLKTAIQTIIKQELKYLYIKKQKLNKQLYQLHLCRQIQSNIDEKLQYYNEKQYTNLNKKLDALQNKRQPYNKAIISNNKPENKFYNRVQNLTKIVFTKHKTNASIWYNNIKFLKF